MILQQQLQIKKNTRLRIKHILWTQNNSLFLIFSNNLFRIINIQNHILYQAYLPSKLKYPILHQQYLVYYSQEQNSVLGYHYLKKQQITIVKMEVCRLYSFKNQVIVLEQRRGFSLWNNQVFYRQDNGYIFTNRLHNFSILQESILIHNILIEKQPFLLLKNYFIKKNQVAQIKEQIIEMPVESVILQIFLHKNHFIILANNKGRILLYSYKDKQIELTQQIKQFILEEGLIVDNLLLICVKSIKGKNFILLYDFQKKQITWEKKVNACFRSFSKRGVLLIQNLEGYILEIKYFMKCQKKIISMEIIKIKDVIDLYGYQFSYQIMKLF